MTDTAYTCQQIVEAVTEYLDGGLPTSERVAFERHVAICPPCRGYLSQMRVLIASAGSLKEESLAANVRAELLDSFRAWRNAQ